MAEIHGIPVPSVDQIVIGAELVFILYPFRMIARALENGMRHERNLVIRHHVKSGHNSRFKRCTEGYCATLQSQLQQPESALSQLAEVGLVDS